MNAKIVGAAIAVGLVAAVVMALLTSGSDDSVASSSVVEAPPFPTVPVSEDGLAFTGGGPVRELEECQARAEQSEIAYQPDRTMIVGRQELVQIVVSVEGDLKLDLPGDGQVVVSDAKLSCVVQAQLVGGSAFDVAPDDPIEVSFLEDDAVTLSWLVTPKTVGPSVLQVQVQSVVTPSDQSGWALNPQAFAAAINVESVPESNVAKVTRWSGQVVDFPLVRGAATLAAAWGVWAGVLRRRRRGSSTEGDVE